jgi:hypothetical protein
LLKFLHYCPISPCIQQPCPAALPGSLARQPCPADLPWQPCSAALPGSLTRQPCPAVRPISTGFDARARSLRSHRSVLNSFAFNYRVGVMRQKLSFFVFAPNESWRSSSGLRGRRRTYYTILKLADHALSKMVRYVFL